MFRRFSTNYALLSMFLDAATIFIALILATLIRPTLYEISLAAYIREPIDIPNILYIIFPMIWVGILMLFSVYDGRRICATDELASLTIGGLLAGVALAGALYLSFRDVSRALFLVFGLTAYFLQVSWRLVARWLFSLSNGTYAHKRRVLIAGAGPVGRNLQDAILKNAFLGLEVVGFLDDDRNKRLMYKDVLGSVNSARRVVHDHKVNDIVVALPPRTPAGQ